MASIAPLRALLRHGRALANPNHHKACLAASHSQQQRARLHSGRAPLSDTDGSAQPRFAKELQQEGWDGREGENVVIVRPSTQRVGEDDEKLRARLLYQSRKRGIKENDLIMGRFAHVFLSTFDRPMLEEYDVILNEHDNEWDMYAWMIGKTEPPEYLQELGTMRKLIDFAKNKDMEVRIELPPLHETPQ